MAAEPVNPAGEAPRPAGGPPSRRGAALLGAVILWVGLLLLLRHFDHRYTLPTIRATAGDLLTRPGEEVTLLVHLERHAADGTVERAGIDVDLRLASEDPTRGIVSTDPEGSPVERSPRRRSRGFTRSPSTPWVRSPEMRGFASTRWSRSSRRASRGFSASSVLSSPGTPPLTGSLPSPAPRCSRWKSCGEVA